MRTAGSQHSRAAGVELRVAQHVFGGKPLKTSQEEVIAVRRILIETLGDALNMNDVPTAKTAVKALKNYIGG